MFRSSYWQYLRGIAYGFPNALRRRVLGYGHPRPGAGELAADAVYAAKTVHAFQEALAHQWRMPTPFAGKRILEFGPGSDLLTGVAYLLLGARSYTALDRFAFVTPALGSAAVHAVAQHLPEVTAARVTELAQAFSHGIIPETLFQYHTAPAEEAQAALTGTFDVIVSQAAMEHFCDPEIVFHHMAALLPPGGVTIHEIDFQTHNRFLREVDPLNILRYTDGVYRALLSFPGAPNRKRPSDFVRMANTAGFVEVTLIPLTQYDVRAAEASRPTLAPPFCRAPLFDLTTLSARLLARKPL